MHKELDVLNLVHHSNKSRAYSKGYDVLAMIDGYENEGREILKAGGYPLTVDEIIHDRLNEDGMPLGKKPLPPRVRDVMAMLQYFETVRHYIKENNISFALGFMAYAVQSAMKARIRPLEPLIQIGTSVKAGQNKSHTKEKLRGIILAIQKLYKDNPSLKGKRAAIWDELKRQERKGKPFQITEGNIQYTILFNGEILIQEKNIAGKKTTQTIKRATFIQHYF